MCKTLNAVNGQSAMGGQTHSSVVADSGNLKVSFSMHEHRHYEYGHACRGPCGDFGKCGCARHQCCPLPAQEVSRIETRQQTVSQTTGLCKHRVQVETGSYRQASEEAPTECTRCLWTTHAHQPYHAALQSNCVTIRVTLSATSFQSARSNYYRMPIVTNEKEQKSGVVQYAPVALEH